MAYLLLVLAATIAVVIFELFRSVGIYRKFRGDRIVICPENRQPAGVRVAAGKAACKALVGTPPVRLSECTRWPEMAGCGQECLSQIQQSPKDCLVSTMVNRWYEGAKCAYCHEAFGEIHWHDHPPALVNEQRQTVQWNEIPLANLKQTLATHWPVCWNCHVAETFRRLHPELVTDRPAH
jgi:hypothetical protein